MIVQTKRLLKRRIAAWLLLVCAVAAVLRPFSASAESAPGEEITQQVSHEEAVSGAECENEEPLVSGENGYEADGGQTGETAPAGDDETEDEPENVQTEPESPALDESEDTETAVSSEQPQADEEMQTSEEPQAGERQ